MRRELEEVFTQLDEDEKTRVIIVTGKGRGFSVGRDTTELFSPEEVERRKDQDLIRMARVGTPLFFGNIGKPVIAAVNGLAVGGGFATALCADIRIAAESARFMSQWSRLGGTPEGGVTYLLPRIVGIAKACELILTSKMIDAKEAREIGLINQVVPDDKLAQTAYEMARSIAKLSPLAIRASKQGLYLGMGANLVSQLQFETLSLHYLRQTEDFQEASKAFIEKRDGIFKER
jgi:2-(1,2-epoxy-1,2-dihydrophenyl)acetyl-CoA isomerase